MSPAGTKSILRKPSHRKALSRRAVLMAGCAGLAAQLLPRHPCAATAIVLPDAADQRKFSVYYKGSRIGAHTILYSAATGETQVSTRINLLVKAAFFTMFRFGHSSTEIWRDGQLMSLSSETVEHGETLRVDGVATPQGFRVVSKGGPFIAPAATLTSNSLWTPAVLEQTTLVDAQYGGIIGVSARKFADEQIMIAGRQIAVTRYTLITPYLAGSIWYDEKNLWVRGEFERDGSHIQYQLDP